MVQKRDAHHHRCECKHARIRFCAKCKVPHCLDCGMEWAERSDYYYWYSGPTTGTITYPDTTWMRVGPTCQHEA